VHATGALPAVGEESGRVRFDFDYLAGFVGVGAAAFQEVAKLVTGDVTIPVAGCADPKAGFEDRDF
jgi:hypothetical protein